MIEAQGVAFRARLEESRSAVLAREKRRRYVGNLPRHLPRWVCRRFGARGYAGGSVTGRQSVWHWGTRGIPVAATERGSGFNRLNHAMHSELRIDVKQNANAVGHDLALKQEAVRFLGNISYNLLERLINASNHDRRRHFRAKNHVLARNRQRSVSIGDPSGIRWK
jgi:hypothetical protein